MTEQYDKYMRDIYAKYAGEAVNKVGDNFILPRLASEVSPKYYSRYKFEPITFIMENNLPYGVGNIIKYIMRHDAKDGVKDLKKARRYIDMMIETHYGKEHV